MYLKVTMHSRSDFSVMLHLQLLCKINTLLTTKERHVMSSASKDDYSEIVIYSRHPCDSETFLENEQSKTTDKETCFVQTFFIFNMLQSVISLTSSSCIHWIRKTGRFCKNGHRSTVPLFLLLWKAWSRCSTFSHLQNGHWSVHLSTFFSTDA